MSWLVQACINALPKGQRPSVLVSSSAVGYYGTSDTDTFTEKNQSGADYLAEVLVQRALTVHQCRGGADEPCC